MKNPYFFLLFMAFSLFVHSQNAYLDKAYGLTRQYEIDFVANDSLFIIGGTYNSNTNYYSLMTVSKAGEPVDSATFYNDSVLTNYSICSGCMVSFTKNDSLRIVQSLDIIHNVDSNGLSWSTATIRLRILDEKLNVLKVKIDPTPSSHMGLGIQQLEKLNDNEFIDVGFFDMDDLLNTFPSEQEIMNDRMHISVHFDYEFE